MCTNILNIPTSKTKGWLWKLPRPCPENRTAPNNFSLTSVGFTFGGETDPHIRISFEKITFSQYLCHNTITSTFDIVREQVGNEKSSTARQFPRLTWEQVRWWNWLSTAHVSTFLNRRLFKAALSPFDYIINLGWGTTWNPPVLRTDKLHHWL